jgi:hypothetical protein
LYIIVSSSTRTCSQLPCIHFGKLQVPKDASAGQGFSARGVNEKVSKPCVALIKSVVQVESRLKAIWMSPVRYSWLYNCRKMYRSVEMFRSYRPAVTSQLDLASGGDDSTLWKLTAQRYFGFWPLLCLLLSAKIR